MKIIAIYTIINNSNGKNYIGSSTDVVARMAAQRSALRKGRHRCKELQNDWDLFGEDSFTIKAVQIFLTKKELPAWEKYYLLTLNCYKHRKVLNVNAYNGKSYVSDKTRQAIELIKSGATAYAASKTVGIPQSTISRSRLYRDWLSSNRDV